MESKKDLKQGRVLFPDSAEEHIEEEVVRLIFIIMEWKKGYDRPGALWRVGTTNDAKTRLEALPLGYVMLGVSSWHVGSAVRAAQEIAEYHGMELEDDLTEDDAEIYAYTDRPPTISERKTRAKDALTKKQKRVFRAIKTYYAENGQGPSKIDVKRMMGHRTVTTTNGFLHILQRKNWIIVPEGRQPIELI